MVSGVPGVTCCPAVPGRDRVQAVYGRGGSGGRNRAADGTAEADAAGEAPGNRRPGRVLICQRALHKKPHPFATRNGLCWVGRVRTLGRGEGSSGLRFDELIAQSQA